MPKTTAPKTSLELAMANQLQLRKNINSSALKVARILAPFAKSDRSAILNMVDAALLTESEPAAQAEPPAESTESPA